MGKIPSPGPYVIAASPRRRPRPRPRRPRARDLCAGVVITGGSGVTGERLVDAREGMVWQSGASLVTSQRNGGTPPLTGYARTGGGVRGKTGTGPAGPGPVPRAFSARLIPHAEILEGGKEKLPVAEKVKKEKEADEHEEAALDRVGKEGEVLSRLDEEPTSLPIREVAAAALRPSCRPSPCRPCPSRRTGPCRPSRPCPRPKRSTGSSRPRRRPPPEGRRRRP